MRARVKIQFLFHAVALVALALTSVAAQSITDQAKERFDRATLYGAAKDSRAEAEYRHAIALRNGVYPEAWQGLAGNLARSLRFKEATTAWRKYLRQKNGKVLTGEIEQLNRLNRGASLKYRLERTQLLTLNEILELVRLVEAFASSEEAVPYAERAVELYPESGQALVILGQMIKTDQKERALELLDRAIEFEPNNATFHVARGQYFFWIRGEPLLSEADFRKAIKLSRGANASAWAGLGDSLARQGRRDEAIAAYQQYLSVRPVTSTHYDHEIKKSIEMLKNAPLKP